MADARIEVPLDAIKEFCRKWQIKEFSLFGSVLSDDFRTDSDIDVLVSFEDDAPWSLYDWVDMLEELKAVFGREVDMVEKEGLRNPYRRRAILSHREVLYAA
ncbi:MAG: nucleotidyltransferase domain-containing protein [Armatimonadota bacterium]|nr:nucleotidyltransferase domain-containing protein [Armatimonadota bacterium]